MKKQGTIYRNYFHQGEINNFKRMGATLIPANAMTAQMKMEFGIYPDYVVKDKAWRPLNVFLPSAKIKFVCKLMEWRWNEYGSFEDRYEYIKAAEERKMIKETRPTAAKEVVQIDKYGAIVGVYPSTMEASRRTGINSSGISQCCNGKQRVAGGYTWKFVEKSQTPGAPKAVVQMDGDEVVATFSSAKEANEATGVSRSAISMCCNGKRPIAGGYSWKFASEVE